MASLGNRPAGKAGRAPIPLRRWWLDHVVRSVDHREVIQLVHEEARWSGHYAVMVVTSAAIAIFGLLLPSPAVVIGAMLISPLMGPIIGFGFGLALFDFAEIRRALSTLAIGVVLAIAITALIVGLSPLQSVTSEIAARTRPNLFDLGVAVFSGLAGTYAMVRGRHGAIVGVAIAVAVMPPLAVMGFGLATFNPTILWGSAFLFLTNLMAIGLTAAILARLYGFGSKLSPNQTWLQVLLVFTTFVALAIPLGLALRQIAWEASVSRQASAIIAGRFQTGARVSQLDMNLESEPIQVSAVVFTPGYRGGVDRDAGRALTLALGRPVEVVIEKVRTGGADAESVQLAEARGAVADRAASRIADRLALVAGIGPDQVLVDREHRVARARAALLPGASIQAYQQLELRAAGGEQGWTIILVPPPAALPEIPDAEDEPAYEAALGTTVWAYRRLRNPIGVSGGEAEAEAVIERLRAENVDARPVPGAAAGPVRLEWLAPGTQP